MEWSNSQRKAVTREVGGRLITSRSEGLLEKVLEKPKDHIARMWFTKQAKFQLQQQWLGANDHDASPGLPHLFGQQVKT